MIDTALTGLLTGLGLIVAIGAQNAFVLRQGIRREHVGVVVLVCALSDLLLICAGVAGIGVVVERAPWLLTALRWGGVAYLLWFAVGAFRSAARPSGLSAGGPAARSGVVRTALALTWLNPHVYLDTVLALGNLANQHGPTGRWWFAAGAGIASVLWFCSLGLGARALAPWLARPSVWRVIDVLVGCTMVLVAVLLALG